MSTKMTALSTIVHPAGTKALLFYNTSSKTLALEVRDAISQNSSGTDSVTAKYESTDASATGLVNNPTSLVSLYLNALDTSLIGVYGIINESTTQPCHCQSNCPGTVACTVSCGRLCLLSPSFEPLGDTTQNVDVTYGRLAGIQVPGASNAGWLYYRSTDSTTKISRFSIDDSSITQVDDAEEPADNTYLAAYYDTDKKERHVLYQKGALGEQNRIYDFTDADTTDLIETKVKNAHYPAGMAAVWVNSNAYLYYVTPKGTAYQLWRAVKTSKGWQDPTRVQTDSDLSESTQVTVTVITDDNNKKKNYVVYTNDSGDIETFQDNC